MPNSLPSAPGVLSIAIPVLNFADFLPATLESILCQEFGNVIEVLVYDGGSKDATPEYMKHVIGRFPNVRYVRALKPGGIDLDISRCVDLTNSQYCWLFSGDDIMHSNGLRRVLENIEFCKPDLILMRHNECDLEMNYIKDWPVLMVDEDLQFNLSLEHARNDYLEKAQSSEAFFSFMSGLVIKRQVWSSYESSVRSMSSNWAHISRIWKAISEKENFLFSYLHEPILNRRGGNDSFSKEGMLSRLGIQINGLLDTMEEIFSLESTEVVNLKRVINNEVIPDWAAAVENDLRSQDNEELLRQKFNQMIARISI
jgi:abequosyltransferase